jgi:hypothetical protein
MNIHDATEQAYKNGYADGKKEVANILSDLKKAVHNKAVYSNYRDVESFVNLKVFDAVLNDFIRRCQGE